MASIGIGREIDDVSAELDNLSRKCEALAERLTGKPGPRSLKNKEAAPSASANSDYAAALRVIETEQSIRGFTLVSTLILRINERLHPPKAADDA